MTRLFLPVLLVLAIPGAALAQQKPGGAPPAIPVIVSPAKLEAFEDRGEALGTLRANESIIVTSSVTETVSAVNFEDGQRVEAGYVLVEMTSGEESAELQAERATVNEASKQMERLKPLVEQGAASRSVLDERRREYETARARLKAIESRMEDRLIRAPFSGVLGLRNISVGALIQPGTQITTLDDDSIMKLDFTVPSVYLAGLAPGLPVLAYADAFGERGFEGSVSAVDSQIDPVTRSVTVRALIPNDEKLLRPGLLMRVELLRNRREAIVIPEESVLTQGPENYVFVIEDSVAHRRPVKTGARRPGDIEVLSGLEAGEMVVTHGTMSVRDGAPVTIRATEEGDETLPELLNQNGQGGEGAGKP